MFEYFGFPCFQRNLQDRLLLRSILRIMGIAYWFPVQTLTVGVVLVLYQTFNSLTYLGHPALITYNNR